MVDQEISQHRVAEGSADERCHHRVSQGRAPLSQTESAKESGHYPVLDGLLDGKSTGQPYKLNDTQRQPIAGMIESGPIPAVHGVVRWRLIDLAQWIFEEFRITIAKQTLSRELRAMGYRKLSARPRHHAQAEGAI